MENLEHPGICVIFAVLNFKFIIMKNYDSPDFDLGEICNAVKIIGSQLGVKCRIHPDPVMASQGYFEVVTLSEDIRSIANKYGFETNVTGDFGGLGKELQNLIDGLKARHVAVFVP